MQTKQKTKLRNYQAMNSHARHAERDMGNKREKGRTRHEQDTRSQVKWRLKTGDYDD